MVDWNGHGSLQERRPMEPVDLFRIGVRWAHAVAAVAWVGGSLFYLLALNPALVQSGEFSGRRELMARVGSNFQEVVRLAILVFLLTGAVLTVDRLTQPAVSPGYVAVLAVKVALSLWMFWIAQLLRRPAADQLCAGQTARSQVPWYRHPSAVLWLGLIVYMLAIVLNVLFEAALQQRAGGL